MKNRTWVIWGTVVFVIALILTITLSYFLTKKPVKSIRPDPVQEQSRKEKVAVAKEPASIPAEEEPAKIRLKEDTPIYSIEGHEVGELKTGTLIPACGVISIDIQGVSTRAMYYQNGIVKLSSLDLVNEPEAPVSYGIRNHQAFRWIHGKKIPLHLVEVLPAGKMGGEYFILNDENPFKWPWETQGTYVFDAAGKFLYRLPIGYDETSEGVEFSPSLKYVGQDEGTWTVRDFTIFTCPSLKKIKTLTYLGLYWVKDNFILFTTVDSTQKPNSPVDLGAYQYVALYDIKKDQTVPVQMYNDLEEYSLTEVHDAYLLLEKTYVERVEDWADSEKWMRKQVKIPNPLRDIHE